MTTIPEDTSIPRTLAEKEQFWKEHDKKQRASGLSKKAYCREHQLRPNQFFYWERKLREEMKSSGELLPVHFNIPSKASGNSESETLCTLAFKNGHELKIHSQVVLPMLLSLWS